VSTGETRIDNIPMYGQPEIERPAHLVKADEDFINSVVSGFGTRKEASKAWWAQGERFMSQGNLDFAMRRYNQSWLLNPNNYQPYWGFARVQLEIGNVDDALKYLEKAESLIDDPYKKVALLADMGSAYTEKGITDNSYFAKANSKFALSTKLDPEYPNSWRRWAFSLYKQEKYREAWEKVDRAENLKARSFPQAFLTALSEKLPRP
jgi:tetratricopeptide (TPR) repeat protein